MRKLLDMTVSYQSKIKEHEKQSKFSGKLLSEEIITLMLGKENHVERLFQSERNMEEMRK